MAKLQSSTVGFLSQSWGFSLGYAASVTESTSGEPRQKNQPLGTAHVGVR